MIVRQRNQRSTTIPSHKLLPRIFLSQKAVDPNRKRCEDNIKCLQLLLQRQYASDIYYQKSSHQYLCNKKRIRTQQKVTTSINIENCCFLLCQRVLIHTQSTICAHASVRQCNDLCWRLPMSPPGNSDGARRRQLGWQYFMNHE